MNKLEFIHLNTDWNAEPNAPTPIVTVKNELVSVSFLLNSFAYEAKDEEFGILNFEGCSRWMIDSTNDHAWFGGDGRFVNEAPGWGEFYEIFGTDTSVSCYEWNIISNTTSKHRHFLFYFRDEAFECFAGKWSLQRGFQSRP